MSKRKTYVVTGVHPVFGHPPGEEFSAVIPETQEALLVAGNALRCVPDKPKPAPVNSSGKQTPVR